MEEQDVKVEGRVHSTRLKQNTLSDSRHASKEGREVLLVFNKDVGVVLRQVCKSNYDSDALHLSKVAQIVRRDMLKPQKAFEGSFTAKCQDQSVPYSLKSLVSMILEGPSISHQTNEIRSCNDQAVLTISQLMIYNSVKHARQEHSGNVVRHNRDRETPLPLSVGLILYAQTRQKGLIDMMHRLGISLSYDRIIQVSAAVGNGVCSLFSNEGVVYPPNLRYDWVHYCSC